MPCPYDAGNDYDLGIEAPERRPGVWVNRCESCGQYSTHHDKDGSQHALVDPADPNSREVVSR